MAELFLADQSVHLSADLLHLWQVHPATNLHPSFTLSCSWNKVAMPCWHLSAVFFGISTPARPVAVPRVGGAALAVNGAVVVVLARSCRRVVAPDLVISRRLGGRLVLRGDG